MKKDKKARRKHRQQKKLERMRKSAKYIAEAIQGKRGLEAIAEEAIGDLLEQDG